MEIPSPYREILNQNIKSVKSPFELKDFVDNCFESLFNRLGNISFQSRAKKSGDMFEYIFYFIIKEGFGIDLTASYFIPEACMEGTGALDFGIVRNGELLCGIETKGSAERMGDKALKRPALKRTDTVKKAISQAYQFKRVFPQTPFYIVTNVKPTSGNAKCMIDLVEGDIVDKVIDITNPREMTWFVDKIREINR